MAISPTAEGFRAAFRRPLLTLGEITWRWTVGATSAALFLFGLIQYLNTLPVSNRELFFLRTRQPYLVAQAIAHILRGSLNRAAMAALVAAFMLGLFWIVAASVGRVASVRYLLDYFRDKLSGGTSRNDAGDAASIVPEGTLRALVRLNFLRAAVALAAILGFVGAAILAGFASSDAHPHPGLVFLLFLPMAGLICLAWWALNWLLSLAGMFTVRDGEDAGGAIFAAVDFCRERTGAVFAVSIWIGLAHLVLFGGATTVVSMPLGFVAIVPWRLVVAVMILMTLAYFALADWLYMARLAGYMCIAEVPQAPVAPYSMTPAVLAGGPGVSAGPPQTAVDRDELILSDVPNPEYGAAEAAPFQGTADS